MDLHKYINKIIDYKAVSKSIPMESIKQTRIQVKHNNVFLSSINKTPLGQINDKFFYLSDGILSFTHRHMNLEEYYKYCWGKSLNEILQNKNIQDKVLVKSNCIKKNQRLYILLLYINSINLSHDNKKNFLVKDCILNLFKYR